MDEPESIYENDYAVIITSVRGNTRVIAGNGNLPEHIRKLRNFYLDVFNA